MNTMTLSTECAGSTDGRDKLRRPYEARANCEISASDAVDRLIAAEAMSLLSNGGSPTPKGSINERAPCVIGDGARSHCKQTRDCWTRVAMTRQDSSNSNSTKQVILTHLDSKLPAYQFRSVHDSELSQNVEKTKSKQTNFGNSTPSPSMQNLGYMYIKKEPTDHTGSEQCETEMVRQRNSLHAWTTDILKWKIKDKLSQRAGHIRGQNFKFTSPEEILKEGQQMCELRSKTVELASNLAESKFHETEKPNSRNSNTQKKVAPFCKSYQQNGQVENSPSSSLSNLLSAEKIDIKKEPHSTDIIDTARGGDGHSDLTSKQEGRSLIAAALSQSCSLKNSSNATSFWAFNTSFLQRDSNILSAMTKKGAKMVNSFRNSDNKDSSGVSRRSLPPKKRRLSENKDYMSASIEDVNCDRLQKGPIICNSNNTQLHLKTEKLDGTCDQSSDGKMTGVNPNFCLVDPRHSLRMLAESHMATRQDEDGDLPLHIAVVQGDVMMVDKLIHMMQTSGTVVDVYNKLRQTPLHLAVLTCHPVITNRLLQAGASGNLADRHGQNCVHICTQNGDMKCLGALVTRSRVKLNLDAKNFEGMTPLHIAVSKGNTESTSLLLEAGANINATDGKSGRTALFHAAENCHLPLVELLLEHGANANIQNYSGNTPLHMASGRGFMEIVTVLVKYGADTTIRNGTSETSFTLAKDRNTLQALKEYTPVPERSLTIRQITARLRGGATVYTDPSKTEEPARKISKS